MAGALTREAEEMLAKVALECGGEISASQEEVLATSTFLGGDNAFPTSEDDEEVFATPPDAIQQQEEVVTMCTQPFTPIPSKSDRSPAAPSPDADDEDVPQANPRRKPRVGTRKVRGARIRTPSPSPEQHQQQSQAETQAQLEQQAAHVDPLVRAVLMMPTTKTTATKTTSSNQNPVEDFLALCRQKGLI